MYTGPDATVVAGVRSRYSCRDVVEVDKHLRWLVGRLERILPALNAARQAHVRGQFAIDFDALLDARIMLAALATLEDDLEGGPPPRMTLGSCPAAAARPGSG